MVGIRTLGGSLPRAKTVDFRRRVPSLIGTNVE